MSTAEYLNLLDSSRRYRTRPETRELLAKA
jgi:hypothetical protein